MYRLSVTSLRARCLVTAKRTGPFFFLLLILMFLTMPQFSSSAHLNQPMPPVEARYRVTMNGFHVSHETKDNAIETDGSFDEIRLMTNTYVINSSGTVVTQRSFKSAVISDRKFRDPDGLTTILPDLGSRRGFKAQDDFPRSSPWRLSQEEVGINISDVPPLTLFEGRLTQGGDAVVIIPSIWEMDGALELRTMYNNELSSLSPGLGLSIGEIIRGPRMSDPNAALREGATVGLGTMRDRVFIGTGVLGLGDPKDRPIGLVKRGDHFGFVPKVLVLTFDAAEAIARTTYASETGVVKISYDDDGDLQGQYVLFLQVKRVGN